MHPLDRRSEPLEAPSVGRRTFLKTGAVAAGSVTTPGRGRTLRT